MLTPRNTTQHVGEVIFKYSIYHSFISGLFYPAIPPPSYLLFPMRKRAADLAEDQQLLVLKRILWQHLTTGDHPSLLHTS